MSAHNEGRMTLMTLLQTLLFSAADHRTVLWGTPTHWFVGFILFIWEARRVNFLRRLQMPRSKQAHSRRSSKPRRQCTAACQRNKRAIVMSEFRRRMLRSGGSGEIVRNPMQAVAIAYSVARKHCNCQSRRRSRRRRTRSRRQSRRSRRSRRRRRRSRR